MSKKKKIDLKTYDSENGGKVFVLSQDITGLNEYEKAKAINHFVNNETKVLETALDSHCRTLLRENGVNIPDGSNSALNQALCELKVKGKDLMIIDRYYELNNERIIAQSPNQMTVIQEDIDNKITLSCAIEVVVEDV